MWNYLDLVRLKEQNQHKIIVRVRRLTLHSNQHNNN